MNQTNELVVELVPNLVENIIPTRKRLFPLIVTDDERVIITDDENLIVVER